MSHTNFSVFLKCIILIGRIGSYAQGLTLKLASNNGRVMDNTGAELKHTSGYTQPSKGLHLNPQVAALELTSDCTHTCKWLHSHLHASVTLH